jgi:hypothetical protein
MGLVTLRQLLHAVNHLRFVAEQRAAMKEGSHG